MSPRQLELLTIVPASKVCKRCGEDRPPDDYFPGSGRYGRVGRCRPCNAAVAKEQRLQDLDKARARDRAYRARNLEKARAAARANYWKNRRVQN
ncbi:hypothetical protein GCM10010412_028080 [Nonomuraea recticatena]|uniref:HNH endonuclease n=1 Tax=Nonomuraea recticatena TaxID=46178 RepID=A0ABP6E118_9ACTN